jgi:hypothetical protein
MPAFVQRPLPFVSFGLALLLCGAAAAQPADAAAELSAGKTLTEVRAELDQARDEAFRLFNEANENDGTDVTCKDEQPTGSRMRQNVCRSAAENRADANAARNFLLARSGDTGMENGLFTAAAQADAQVGSAEGLSEFERQWNRLLEEDPNFEQAVSRYVALEKEYDSGNVARVSGTVSIAACPAGTNGAFTLVARVRDEAGESTTIEFPQTWQRADNEDHTFNADYPIGDDVELMSVRVRNLKCTCAETVQ